MKDIVLNSIIDSDEEVTIPYTNYKTKFSKLENYKENQFVLSVIQRIDDCINKGLIPRDTDKADLNKNEVHIFVNERILFINKDIVFKLSDNILKILEPKYKTISQEEMKKHIELLKL